MATARATIKLALRKLGVLGFNRTADAGQEAEALEVLNRMMRGLIGFGGSHPIISLRADQSLAVDPRWPAVRLQLVAGGLTVTLPKNPADGARLHLIDVAQVGATQPTTLLRNGMLVAGSAADVTLNTNGFDRTYMFRADLGDWRPISTIAITDELPFTPDLDDDAARLLGHELQSLFGKELPPYEAARVPASRGRFRARYVKPPPSQFDGPITSLGGDPILVGRYIAEDF